MSEITHDGSALGEALAKAFASGGIMCKYDPKDIHLIDIAHGAGGFYGDEHGNFCCDVHEIHRCHKLLLEQATELQQARARIAELEQAL